MRLRHYYRLTFLLAIASAGCGSQQSSPEPASTVQQPAPAPPSVGVYITNETSGDLSVIDANTQTVVSTISLGKRPRGIAVSPDKSTLYVALSGSPPAPPGVDESTLPPPDRTADGIGVVDIRQQKLIKVLPSGTDPEVVAVSHDGTRVFVANEDAAIASVVDVATGKILQTFPTGEEPEGVAVQPGAERVWVTSEDDGTAVVIDLPSQKVVKAVPVGPRPRSRSCLTDRGRTSRRRTVQQ
jgi:YVTN family beta-propeller protein